MNGINSVVEIRLKKATVEAAGDLAVEEDVYFSSVVQAALEQFLLVYNLGEPAATAILKHAHERLHEQDT